ncbi:uncharacterized protein K460DRAFT_414222 [Cucurbitaria berberidis CBS 394.84]|uniref:Ricin B lectin domain-containing protein n=1 Tax=Cucurbitaria berberidis CBS 394.84 TaxID=1168544 RepID=A0A9P4LAG8_9PLEO|nr:uncharacterized protein K460DRAFT_414222 [Cucurbitaria berberidis CBS 394.84]KAF1847478.1 hypothetical protein K460DRAFT_414222 [Cucurbitaria berberidis CBS 394.84]
MWYQLYVGVGQSLLRTSPYSSSGSRGKDASYDEKDSGILSMSPNVTAPQNGQRWRFKSITAINNDKYSSINLVGAVVATSSNLS